MKNATGCPDEPHVCASARDEGLARPWRAVEEHTTGRAHAEGCEDLWVEQRQQHHLLERINVPLQATHRIPPDGPDAHRLHVALCSVDGATRAYRLPPERVRRPPRSAAPASAPAPPRPWEEARAPSRLSVGSTTQPRVRASLARDESSSESSVDDLLRRAAPLPLSDAHAPAVLGAATLRVEGADGRGAAEPFSVAAAVLLDCGQVEVDGAALALRAAARPPPLGARVLLRVLLDEI